MLYFYPQVNYLKLLLVNIIKILFVLFISFINSSYLGPAELNFGDVCVNAPVTKFLSVLNNLDQFIVVQIDV